MTSDDEGAGPAKAGRAVLHVDMDAFYASVEMKEDASLLGRPVVVGGTGPRGVVASASYEARAFGVRSAMPGAQARRLCPHAVFLPPHFDLYHRYSERLHAVLRSFTPLVEGIGLDEAFLDVSACRALFGSPTEIAAAVHARVADELGLQCSIGAGPNKLIAKLASKAAKPKVTRGAPLPGPGTVVIMAPEVLGFLWPLAVESLWGVGPVSGERLHKLGVTTVGELAAVPESSLVGAFGKASGHLLHRLAWGEDDRPVAPAGAPKSIGHEETYPTDIADREELGRRLVVMADAVASRVREHHMVARTVTLKLRYGNFTTLTRSHTFPSPQSAGNSFWAAAQAMLDGLELKGGARLLGISVTGLAPVTSSSCEQLELDLASSPSSEEGTGTGREAPAGDEARRAGWDKASQAVDAVRARFGPGSLRPARALERPASAKGGP